MREVILLQVGRRTDIFSCQGGGFAYSQRTKEQLQNIQIFDKKYKSDNNASLNKCLHPKYNI